MTTTTNPFFNASPFWNNGANTSFGGWIPPFNGFPNAAPSWNQSWNQSWNSPYANAWNTPNTSTQPFGFNPLGFNQNGFNQNGFNPFSTPQGFGQFPFNQFAASQFATNPFQFSPVGFNPFGFGPFGYANNPFAAQNTQPFHAWFQQPTPFGFQPVFQSTFAPANGPQNAWWNNPNAFVGPTVNPQNATETAPTSGVPVFFTPGFGFTSGPFNFNPSQQAA